MMKSDTRKHAQRNAAAPREGSKKQIVLDLLRRRKGATLTVIMAASAWQKHSVRGFIAGAVHLLPGADQEAARRVDTVLRKAIEQTRQSKVM